MKLILVILVALLAACSDDSAKPDGPAVKQDGPAVKVDGPKTDGHPDAGGVFPCPNAERLCNSASALTSNACRSRRDAVPVSA